MINPRKCLHFNYVPDDPRFMAAAISFVVDARGCCRGNWDGSDGERLEFLEMFQCADLEAYPEFFDNCEDQGLPVVRGAFVYRERWLRRISRRLRALFGCKDDTPPDWLKD